MHRDLYVRVRQHAVNSGEVGGWDYFVETISEEDFVTVCEDRGLDNFDRAVQHWSRWCRINSGIRDDISREAF